MTALKNILTISKGEITRFRTRFKGKPGIVILVILILFLILSLILYHQEFVLSKGLYTVGVSPDGPVIMDSRFNSIVVDLDTAHEMLTTGAIDVYIYDGKAIVRNDERSQYAAGALKQYLEHAEIKRIASEYSINQAFPLRIEINQMKTSGRALDIDSNLTLSDILGLTESPDMPGTAPYPEKDSEEGIPPPLVPTSSPTDNAVRQQLRDAEEGKRLPEFKAEFVSDKEIIIPSLMNPPIPLAQVIMAFFYVVPIFFVSVFFTSSFIDEKTGRKLVILMSTPVTTLQVIIGKMLPYIGYSVIMIIIITLLLKGNVLLALTIFVPVMLFILSIYLIVALTYRTFRDQTFFSVLAVAIITGYLVAPAMFSGISNLSYISPLTLSVQMYQGKSFGPIEYFLSTTPMYLIFILVMFVGKRIFNEEYLIGFKPLHKKIAEAIYLIIDRNHLSISVFALSSCMIPIVFMVQLLSIVIATNLPVSFIFGGALVISVVAEEIAKSAGIVVLMDNNIVKSLKNILILSCISALGFMAGEKLLLYLAFSVITESMFTNAIFSTGLFVIPLVVHAASTSVVCLITAHFGTRYYALAITAGSIIHSLYNLYIIGMIL